MARIVTSSQSDCPRRGLAASCRPEGKNGMTEFGNGLGRVGWARYADAVLTNEADLILSSVSHTLRHGIIERMDSNYLHGAIESMPCVSGAIFLSLHPKQLAILIADARTSIVLAIQRHLHNERYRRRLVREFHYRALRPHLSDSFLLLMVRPSHSDKYAFSAPRGTSLAVAYKDEIDRLEAEFFGRDRVNEVVYGPQLKMLKLANSRKRPAG
jgi:hypothetical protein